MVTFVVSRTILEIWRLIGRKSPIRPTPPSFNALARGEPLRILGWTWYPPETRMMGLSYGEEIMIVGRTIWTQCTSVTDRRTDRITLTKTVQRIASHGNNCATRCCPLASNDDFRQDTVLQHRRLLIEIESCYKVYDQIPLVLSCSWAGFEQVCVCDQSATKKSETWSLTWLDLSQVSTCRDRSIAIGLRPAFRLLVGKRARWILQATDAQTVFGGRLLLDQFRPSVCLSVCLEHPEHEHCH